MFQFPGFPAYDYFIHRTLHGSSPCGFPHSDIHGSQDICSSPWLFAACHVLRRLPMPMHSPCALSRLNSLCISWIQLFSCLNCCVSHLQLLSFFRFRQNCFFYPPERPDFFNLVFSLCFLLCLFVCCYLIPSFHQRLDNSTSFYSVFNELSPAFNRLLRYHPFFKVNTLKPS